MHEKDKDSGSGNGRVDRQSGLVDGQETDLSRENLRELVSDYRKLYFETLQEKHKTELKLRYHSPDFEKLSGHDIRRSYALASHYYAMEFLFQLWSEQGMRVVEQQEKSHMIVKKINLKWFEDIFGLSKYHARNLCNDLRHLGLCKVHYVNGKPRRDELLIGTYPNYKSGKPKRPVIAYLGYGRMKSFNKPGMRHAADKIIKRKKSKL